MIRLQDIAEKWNTIAAVGATVAATATAFLRPPPIGDRASGVVAIGGFLATVCSGLIYVAMARWCARVNTAVWVSAAAAGVILAIASFHAYEQQWDSYVGTYQGEPQVVGDTLTDGGAAFVKQNGSTDPTTLLFAANGDAEQVWTSDSIRHVRARMRLTYLAGFPLVATGLLSTIQAVHCALKKGSRR